MSGIMIVMMMMKMKMLNGRNLRQRSQS
jgi:hypothetical protein